MKHLFKNPFMIVIITLALLISALGVTPAFADDGTPPPPATEEPTQPPVAATEPETVATQPPAEATSIPEATQPPVEATTAPEATEEVSTTEATPVAEILSEVPENTDVVALDENNEPLPLTSEEAAEVVEEADPKWCPEGELPNSPNCSANFPTIEALLTDMRDHPENYSQDGVIYFERMALTTYTSSFVLDDSLGSLGTSYDLLKGFNLTLTGGWSGGTSASIPGRTVFGGPDAFIQVGSDTNPWSGNVTLNNIQIGDTTHGGVSTNNSLTIYTTSGDITLNNLDVTQQEGNNYTAYLQSDSGDITVGPSLNLAAPGGNSVFDGNNASGKQNKGFSATTTTGTISISAATFQQAIQPGTDYSHGATLSAPVINLTNVTAKGNDGSGIYVNGTGSTIVNVFGGTYTNNKRYGIEVIDSLLNEQSAPTCSGNIMALPGNPCYNVTPNSPEITVNNLTVESDTLGGWTLAFNAIGSASDPEDGTPSVSCSPAIGSLLPVGSTTTVSCTATDQSGFTATDAGDITVVDTTAPSLSLPSDRTEEATSPAGAMATFSASATDLVDGTVTVTCTPASGDVFTLGTTSVGCSATDSSGNTATGSFNVTVVDTTAPSLSLPSTITLAATSPSGAVATFSASATDVVDGIVSVACTPASGSLFPLGITSVDCSATDGAGNTASDSFNVVVKDADGPILSLPGDISIVVHEPGRAIITYSASATDPIEGPVPVTCAPASGSVFPMGTTSVNCSATDSVGNKTNGSFHVTVDIDRLRKTPAYIVTQQTQAQLPGTLGQGQSFVSALKLEFLDPAAKPQNAEITLFFPVSDDMKDAKLAVMFWDGSKWVEMSGGSLIGKYFVITVNRPGVYILVSR